MRACRKVSVKKLAHLEAIAREYAAAELREKFDAVGFTAPDCVGKVTAENVEAFLSALAAGVNDPHDRRESQTMLGNLREIAVGFDQFYATH
jgi:hypothetical protein